MKKMLILGVLLYWDSMAAAQVGVGTHDPDPSAALDIVSDSKGILIPRMTAAQRDAIRNPATGLEVYVTGQQAKYYFDGVSWVRSYKTKFSSSYQVYAFEDVETGTGADSQVGKQMAGLSLVFRASDADYAEVMNAQTIRILESGTYILEVTGVMKRIAEDPQFSGRTMLRRNGANLKLSDASIGASPGGARNSTGMGVTVVADLVAGDLLTLWYRKTDAGDAHNVGFQNNMLTIKR
ncbi:hypothetical protein ACFOET_16095 [Parapedobacter deserti]|uniref:C1q domain-containing protein n=1 Tax=Parapedobacter deserti TaxID=1912957 RepID=A0ABV7JPW5_9SPHI